MKDKIMLISHPEEGSLPEKSLQEHLENVADISRQQINKMRLNISPDLISKKMLAEISFLIGMFHDFGKATSFFQDYIIGKRKKSPLTRHGFISAVICYHIIFKKKEMLNKHYVYWHRFTGNFTLQ